MSASLGLPVSSSLSCLERAASWLLSSGIQEPSGGVARYYRTDLKRNAPVSTEITGYAVHTLVYLYEQTQDLAYLKAAKRAADFLCGTAWDAELDTMRFELAPAPAYFFDCGIIARGLLSLYRLTQEPVYLQIAEGCGRTMARDFRMGGGRYHPIVDLPSRQPRTHGVRWSQDVGCYQLKSGMAWLELFEETGHTEYLDLYQEMLADALAGQAAFLPGAHNPVDVMDRLHPYCYFLEAVMPVAQDGRLGREIADGIDRTAHWLRKIAPDFVRADAYAQLLRVRLLASSYSLVPLEEEAADEEYRALLRFQIQSPDVRLDGGFCFGRLNGSLMPFANPVTTAFGLQAVDAYEQFLRGRFALTRHSLI